MSRRHREHQNPNARCVQALLARAARQHATRAAIECWQRRQRREPIFSSAPPGPRPTSWQRTRMALHGTRPPIPVFFGDLPTDGPSACDMPRSADGHAAAGAHSPDPTPAAASTPRHLLRDAG